MPDASPKGTSAPGAPAAAEQAASDLVRDVSAQFEEYVKAWFASYDAALSGNYDAARLLADASKMTTGLIRGTTKLLLSGFDIARVLANPDAPATTTGPGKSADQADRPTGRSPKRNTGR
ncbi:MAG TPA: hypothetical protein VE623_03110 [Acidimicrobiales bacterium]|jgi:hypothetical protein|nr:hypothetical protein [Acidimicrobiales bacterium]